MLRSLLVRCPQWRDVENRRRTARLAVSQGEVRVAEALATGKSSNMHKDELLWLARAWGLRSNVWKRRGAKGEPAETPAASAAAPAATEPEGPSRPRTRKAAAAAAVKAPEVKVKVEVKQEQESESGMIELFGSPASPTGPAAAECGSVVSALTAIMDRGVYGDGTDYSSLLLAFNSNAIPQIQAVADKILKLQLSAEYVCGPLLEKWSDAFITNDTLNGLNSIFTQAQNIMYAVRHAMTVSSFRLLQSKSLGPAPVGAEPMPLTLTESDLWLEVLGRDVSRCFFDMKERIVALKAQRGFDGAPNAAKAAWEDLHLSIYQGQLELLSQTLVLMTLARKNLQAQGTCSLYFEVACALGSFSCRYQTETTAAILVRKNWVKKVLDARAMREAVPRFVEVSDVPTPPAFANAKCEPQRGAGAGAPRRAPSAIIGQGCNEPDCVMDAMSHFTKTISATVGQVPQLAM